MSPENQATHVRAELARGQEALRAARELVRLGLTSDAVSRAYYAAFHAARALLLSVGVEPETHSGVSTMLGLHFIVPGLLPAERAKDLARLAVFRAEADYNRFFILTPEGALEEVETSARFFEDARKVLEKAGLLAQ